MPNSRATKRPKFKDKDKGNATFTAIFSKYAIQHLDRIEESHTEGWIWQCNACKQYLLLEQLEGHLNRRHRPPGGQSPDTSDAESL